MNKKNIIMFIGGAIVVILLIITIRFMTNKNTETTTKTDDKITPVVDTQTEDKTITATIKTNMGDIKIELYEEKAPEAVKNFITLSKEGKYDGVPFHRVIKDFMIQTGDFENKNGTGGYSYKGVGTYLKDEIDSTLTHKRGAVSMANRGLNTSGSQFFIVQNKDGAKYLDGGYTIFGQTIEGMEVVDKIADLKTDANNKPLGEGAKILSVEIK